MATIAERLAARTLELVDIPSESRNEAAIAAHVAGLVPTSFEPEYHGEDAAVFVRPRRPGRELVVLAGHYDTVPAQGNLPGRVEDGAVVGLGASDMKGGLAVLLELARELHERGAEPEVDLALLLFGREELPPEFNPLPQLFDHSPTVREAALAILLEPTDGAIHAGCLGNLNVRLVFRGVSGHSARPWAAENAIEAALEGLRTLAHVEPRPVDVAGLTFTEVVSVTQIHGGIADNVIPDLVTAHVNFRYAPDRSPESAEAHLLGLLPRGVEVVAAGHSPAGRVVADSALVRRLRAAGDLGLEPKQAWTNVADFTSRGIDAVNFGPGATRWAHARDERVEIAALEHAFASLWRFLTGSV
ncbi:MAG TPA: succinyl-diaminopimelate desuccinylase [Gaiellaceae bacterium]|nr:succinyl-diaminopimelate desuccinylase [Gaiellaceae bacterium]